MIARHAAVPALLLLLSQSALAADPAPEVSISADGAIVGRMLVPAAEADVRAVVDDPIKCAELSAEIVSVSSKQSGRCAEVTTETKGLFRPLRFLSRRCPTSDGWQEDLVQSDDFNAYESTWELRAVEGGTEVVLSVKSDVNLSVPDSLVRSRTRHSVGEILVNLARRAVGK